MSELLGFSKVVSGYGDARILHDVDLAIRERERVAILGRNGVGKTTIVNTFLGVAHLIAGEVRIAGQRQSAIRHFTAARLGIAVVPQGRRIIPNLTVRENLILGGAVGRSQPWTQERVFDLFPILRERADTLGTSLSGGQQQRVAIARALAKRPDVLLCDEPTGSLDYATGKKVLEVLERANRELGTLTVVITHNAAIAGMADRVVRISSGEILDVRGNAKRLSPGELSW